MKILLTLFFLFFSSSVVANIFECTVEHELYTQKYIISADDLMCGNIYGHILSKQESIDIDDIFDFKFAEYLYTNKINLNEKE